MTILFLLALLVSISVLRRLPVVETTILSLLIVPVIGFPVGHVVALGTAAYWVVLLGWCTLVWFVIGPYYVAGRESRPSAAQYNRQLELMASAVLVGSYVCLYLLCLIWPDFISIGERLRDYALLNSVRENPTAAFEPWMEGAPLYYYLYWYRFGHFIGTLFDEPVWAVYHQLAALALTLYLTVIYRLLSKHFEFRPQNALLGGVLVAFGSNVVGIHSFLSHDSNWWGPSRVFRTPMINEFPAWSFLLGDIHPHYLNLCLMPFAILLALTIESDLKKRMPGIIILLLALPLWLVNANLWEVPVWGIFVGISTVVGLALWLFGKNLPAEFSNTTPAVTPSHVAKWGEALMFFFVCVSLAWSTLHLRPDPVWTPPSTEAQQILKWVGTPEVPGSLLFEVLRHWGIILTGIMLSAVAIERNEVMLAVSGLLLGAVYTVGLLNGESALIFLGILFGFLIIQLYFEMADGRHLPLEAFRERSLRGVIVATLPLTFVALVIFPEVFFFDDPYGGDIERMNTIFKFYSAGWFFGWMALILLTRRAWLRLSDGIRGEINAVVPPVLAKFFCLVILTGFTISAIDYRKTERFTVEPRAQGLSSIDQRFSGAAGAIQRLSKLPHGRVLEAQGNAYDYTTHVATLSGNPAFLGWGNHVGLLLRNYTEVQRRERVTETFYKEPDCQKRRALAFEEHIAYVVVGPLERSKYGAQGNESMRCFSVAIESGDYKIFTP